MDKSEDVDVDDNDELDEELRNQSTSESLIWNDVEDDDWMDGELGVIATATDVSNNLKENDA